MTLEPGKYRARAIPSTAQFGEAKNERATPFVQVEFAIEDDRARGESITWRGFLSDAAQTRTIESLVYCGCAFPKGEIDNLDGLGTQPVDLVCENEEYEGKTRLRVRWVNRAGGIPVEKPIEGDAKKAFAQRMKGGVLAVLQAQRRPASAGGGASGSTGGVGTPSGNAPKPADADDDNVPF